MIPILSILTPAVPSRIAQVDGLSKKLATQIGCLPVEHLILMDNKRRTVGEKRDALLRAAIGDYVAFVDDDDDVSSCYVQEILAAINYAAVKPDVVTFLQKATVDGQSAIIEFGLGNANEAFAGLNGEKVEKLKRTEPETPIQPFNHSTIQLPRIRRNAWHICAWRRELAIQSSFPAINYGEDWAYASPLCAIARNHVHIPKILHFYRHNSQTTEAPPPSFVAKSSCSSEVDAFRKARPPEYGDCGKPMSEILRR